LLINEKEKEYKQIRLDWKEREEEIEDVMKEQRDTITGQSLEIITLNDKVKSTKTKYHGTTNNGAGKSKMNGRKHTTK